MTNGLTILGVPIDNVSMDETLEAIDGFVRQRSFHQIATANVDFLVNAIENPTYREVLSRCDLVIPDGMPIVLASRLLGSPLTERVAGSDLVPLLAKRKYKIFLLGAKPEVSLAAAKKFEEMGSQVVGRLSPPLLPLEQFDNDAILSEIEKADPDILLVALGSPKQELWIHQNRSRLKVPVAIGVGGSLDFLTGAVSRAPGWMQKASLEWVYRIWMEPKRLALRYLKGAIWMARYFPGQFACSLARRGSWGGLQIAVDSVGSVNIVSLSGNMSGPKLAELEKAAAVDGALVLDVSNVSYLGADGLRTLGRLFREAANRGTQLWLAGARPALERMLKASRCEGLVRAVPSVFAAIRQASGGRLQMSLELGNGWAVCRMRGEIPPGARRTLDGICRQVLESNEFFELDSDGVPEFDASGLVEPAQSACRVIVGERPQGSVAQIAV
jgi:N-acetylglucosaminyldiphosphoundecaprenol N-acetyl-beta-D-mannosaminyltransferase